MTTKPLPLPLLAQDADTQLSVFLAERAHLHRGALLFTTVTSGMANLTLNWLLSLERVGVDARVPVILCMDAACFAELDARGLTVMHLTAQAIQELEDRVVVSRTARRVWTNETLSDRNSTARGVLEYNSPAYNSLMQVKVLLPMYLLRRGHTIQFHDVDIVFVRRHPTNGVDVILDTLQSLSRQHRINAVFSYELSGYVGERNVGLYAMRPAPELQLLLTLTLEQMRFREQVYPFFKFTGAFWFARPTIQPSFLKHLRANGGRLMRTAPALDCRKFMNGVVVFKLDWLQSNLRSQYNMTHLQDFLDANWTIPPDSPLQDALPYTIHANYYRSSKTDTLKRFKLWWLPEDRTSWPVWSRLSNALAPSTSARERYPLDGTLNVTAELATVHLPDPVVPHNTTQYLYARAAADADTGANLYQVEPKQDMMQRPARMDARHVDDKLCAFDVNFFDAHILEDVDWRSVTLCPPSTAIASVTASATDPPFTPSTPHKRIVLAQSQIADGHVDAVANATQLLAGARLVDLQSLPADVRPAIHVLALDYAAHDARLAAHRPTVSMLRTATDLPADCANLIAPPRVCTKWRMLEGSFFVLDKCAADTVTAALLKRRERGWTPDILSESVHIGDAFSAPFVVVFRRSFSVSDGSVLNADVHARLLSLGVGPDSRANHAAMSALDNLTIVDASKTTLRFRTVVSVGALPAPVHDDFHALNNGIFRLGLHLPELLALFRREDKAGVVDTVVHIAGPPLNRTDALVRFMLDMLGFPPGTYDRRVVSAEHVVYGDVVVQVAPSLGHLVSAGSHALWAFRDFARDALARWVLLHEPAQHGEDVLAWAHQHQQAAAAGAARVRTDAWVTLVIGCEGTGHVIDNCADVLAGLRTASADARVVELVDADFAPPRNLTRTLALFAAARAIVAPHNSKLVYIAFAAPGAHVYEVLPEQRLVLSHYSMATVLAHHYTGIISPAAAAVSKTATGPAAAAGRLRVQIDDLVWWYRRALARG